MKYIRGILICALIVFIFGCIEKSTQSNQSESQLSTSIQQPKITNFYSDNYIQPQQPLNRNEVLEKTLKGYREQTYWGNEHPIDERIRNLDDKEFKRFVEEEIKQKDADVYWGAEY